MVDGKWTEGHLGFALLCENVGIRQLQQDHAEKIAWPHRLLFQLSICGLFHIATGALFIKVKLSMGEEKGGP